MSKTFAVAVSAILFVCASSAQAQIRERVTATVRYSDLDLRRADQRAQFGERVRRAAAIACGPITQDMQRNIDIHRCRSEMRADAVVQVAALTTAPVALASNR